MTRPSVFDTSNFVAADASEARPTAVEAVAPVPAKSDKNIVKTSTYLPREVHDVLREIAFHERTKVHDLLIEGIEHVLRARRHPSITELKKRHNG